MTSSDFCHNFVVDLGLGVVLSKFGVEDVGAGVTLHGLLINLLMQWMGRVIGDESIIDVIIAGKRKEFKY